MSLKSDIAGLAQSIEHPHGGPILLFYDSTYAEKHHEQWDAFKGKLYERLPNFGAAGIERFLPHEDGFVLHWPHPDGDEMALNLFMQQCPIQALDDLLEYFHEGPEEPYVSPMP